MDHLASRWPGGDDDDHDCQPVVVTTAKPVDGIFTVQVLVLARDQVGPRKLVATAGDRSANDDFLVVPGTVDAATSAFGANQGDVPWD